MTGAGPPARCDVAVVGAGIVGLAVARELALRDPRRTVCVLEREQVPAAHQTSHNSGVVHSGLYYEPGSLKARLCVEGARDLRRYCERRALPFEACGKLVVARDVRELARLDELERRGRANGVPGLERLDAAGMRSREPSVRGLAALHSPETAITDFAAVARAFAEDLLGAGGTLATGCEVWRLEDADGGVRIGHAHGSLHAGSAVVCAGAWSDRLAVAGGAGADPRIVPFRGAYLRLRPGARGVVRGLVYPVPDPELPFLGVHITPTVAGEVLIGPTALLAATRDGRRGRRIEIADVRDTLAWPGTWRMCRRWWRSGVTELRRAVSVSAVVGEASRLVEGLSAADVEHAFVGVRAQALGRDGRLLDDFAFSSSAHTLHVRNAPSPAASSSLAIARVIADRIA